MTLLQKEKAFSREWFMNYSLMVTGCFILASGFVFFITPNRIVPGGVYGISIVIHYVTKGMFSFAQQGIPVGLMGLVLNIPLTIIAIRILGPRFGVKTILGFFLTSGFIDLQTWIYGYEPLVKDDLLLSSVFGGVLIGFGLGLIFKSKASSGGSDILAMIFAKYNRLPLGQLLIYIDSVIVLLGLVVFRDWKIPLYSWIVIFISGKVIDTTMQGLDYNKALFIISDKYEAIVEKILNDLGRGATAIPVKGMYKGQERQMIFVNVNRREMVILQDYIRGVDQNAFVTVFNTTEIFGEGFKSLKEN